MAYVIRKDADGTLEKFYTARRNKKQAAENLRRLVNTNFENDSVNVEISYTSNTDTSLLTVNK